MEIIVCCIYWKRTRPHRTERANEGVNKIDGMKNTGKEEKQMIFHY